MVVDEHFTKKGKYYANGVGSYSANWDTIQAEWFFKKSEMALKKEGPAGGFEIQNLINNSYVDFPNIKDLKANATINFNVSSISKNVRIEIREDSSTGTLLGTCVLPNTGSFANYKTVACNLKNTAEITNLFFVFKGEKGELARFDWFNFSK
jgi:hypothetical protein